MLLLDKVDAPLGLGIQGGGGGVWVDALSVSLPWLMNLSVTVSLFDGRSHLLQKEAQAAHRL